jgi:hypothetical protein
LCAQEARLAENKAEINLEDFSDATIGRVARRFCNRQEDAMTNPRMTHAARISQMRSEYYEVRQYSIGGQVSDIEGWRVSRLMRDAQTPVQADEVDDKLNEWVRETASNSRASWRPFRAFFCR